MLYFLVKYQQPDPAQEQEFNMTEDQKLGSSEVRPDLVDDWTKASVDMLLEGIFQGLPAAKEEYLRRTGEKNA